MDSTFFVNFVGDLAGGLLEGFEGGVDVGGVVLHGGVCCLLDCYRSCRVYL